MGRWQVQNYLDKKASGTLPRKIEPRFEMKQGEWKGQTVFVIGGGPSLREHEEQLPRLKAFGKVCTVNMGFRMVPQPDIAYFGSVLLLMKMVGDHGFGRLHKRVALDAMLWNMKHNYGCEAIGALPPSAGWSEILEEGLPVLSNSGAVVLNLLDLLGCARIVLLGYDLHPGKDGKTVNWHSEYQPYMKPDRAPYDDYLRDFEHADACARASIFNCNPDSALRLFDYMPLEAFLG